VKIIKLDERISPVIEQLLPVFAANNIAPMGHTLRFIANEYKWVRVSIASGKPYRNSLRYFLYCLNKLNTSNEILLMVDFSGEKTDKAIYEVVQNNYEYNYFINIPESFTAKRLEYQLKEQFVNKLIMYPPSGNWFASSDGENMDIIFFKKSNKDIRKLLLLPAITKVTENFNIFPIKVSPIDFSGTQIKVTKQFPLGISTLILKINQAQHKYINTGVK
jgi:hypothetical protein